MLLDRQGLAAAILASAPAHVPRLIMEQQFIPLTDPEGLSSALIEHYETHRDQIHAAFLCMSLLQSTAGRKLLTGLFFDDDSLHVRSSEITREDLLFVDDEPAVIAREIFGFLTDAEPSLQGVLLGGRLIRCAIALIPIDRPDDRSAMGDLASQICEGLVLLSEADPNDETLDEIIALYRAVLNTDASESTTRAQATQHLFIWLAQRFHRHQDLADYRAAASHFEQLQTVFQDDPEADQASRPMRVLSFISLGEGLIDIYDRGAGSADLLMDAIDCFEHLRALLTPESEYWVAVHLALGSARHNRFKETGSVADLQQASHQLSIAARASAADRDAHGGSLMNWASVLADRYSFSGDEAFYRQALDLYDSALKCFPSGSHHWAATSMGWANTLLDHFEIAGDPDDLIQALAHFEAAAQTFEPNTPAWALCQVNFANALSSQFEVDRDSSALEQALQQIRSAIEFYEQEELSRDLAKARVNYAIGLRRRYELTGRNSDFDLANESFAQAAKVLPAATRDGAWCRTSWADAFTRRYEARGNTQDLERAGSLYQEVIDSIPAGSLERSRATLMVANVAFMRYLHDRGRVDLEHALDLYRSAAGNFPQGTASWARAQAALGVALMERHAEQPGMGALNEALGCFTQALECFPPNSLDAARCLTNLANAYSYRYFAGHDDDDADLRQAIALYEQAARLFPEMSASRASRLHNAGLTRLLCFDLFGHRDDLDHATICFTAATEIYRRSDRVADQHLALYELGRCHVAAGEWLIAWEVLAEAIEALETQLFDLPTQSDQLALVTRHGDAYQLMVTACLALAEQDPEAKWLQTAWEYAERARARLTLQTILAAAAASADEPHGERNAALGEWGRHQRALTDRLQAVARRGPGVVDIGPPDLDALREMERAVTTARRRFDDVAPELAALRTISTPDLAAVQTCLRNVPDGALVIEFMVLPDSVQLFLVDGDDIHTERLHISESELRRLTDGFRHDPSSAPDAQALEDALTGLGRHLIPILAPYLSRLGASEQPHSGRVPHVLFVPSGDLHFWPLHALPLADGRRLIDLVAVGLLPAASALPELARQQALAGPYQALVPEAYPPLPFGTAQAHVEASIFAAGLLEGMDLREGRSATFEALAGMRGGVLGFSTHARADLDEPERSSVQLADGSGGLISVSALEFLVSLGQVKAGLLLLWGCQTHGTGAAGGDNWLGVSRAFLSAGRALVASLWSIDNRATLGAGIELAQGLQQGLTVPQALRQAMLAVRDADIDDVEGWRAQVIATLPEEAGLQFVEDWDRALSLPDSAALRRRIRPFAPLWIWAPYVTIGWPGRLGFDDAMTSVV